MKNTIFTGAGVALITPMHADGSVNYEELERLIEFQIENGTDAIVSCGTTGESATLTHQEHVDVLKINNKIVLRRRLKKLCDCKVLDFHLEKNSKGTFTYYRTGVAYKTLLYDMIDRKHFE